MTTLTLTLPDAHRRTEATASLVQSIHEAIAAHLSHTVSLVRTFPAPRLITGATVEAVEAAAALYLPGLGITWRVTA